jgi:H+/Cl- antiporter ClcA
MKRLFPVLFVTVTSLTITASAFAHDNGEGLVGETNDRDITFFALGLVVFFTVFVIVMSALQGALEKRKEARKASDLKQRIGW